MQGRDNLVNFESHELEVQPETDVLLQRRMIDGWKKPLSQLF